MSRDIVILDGARTAIGTFGGTLAGTPPIQLATHVAKAALERSGIRPGQIGNVVFGHVINTEPRDMYLSRCAAIEAGIPDTTPSMNVNRLCGSGAQAIVSCVQALAMGDAEFALAGGAESMSRSPHAMQVARFGQKMGDARMVDMMIGALECPFGTGHMGVTAENVAAEHQITREQQDAFALESQQRTRKAQEGGHFAGQIVPITIKTRKGDIVFDCDEHPKPETTAEGLAALKPAFKKDGTVTAGNAPGVNDGAAAMVVMSEEFASKGGHRPQAEIIASASSGIEPKLVMMAPIEAVNMVLRKTGWSVDEVDLFELNEAFSVQAVALMKELKLNPERVNVNGGAVALGHPIGASGARVLTTLIHAMAERKAKKGIAALCLGGGNAVAMAIRAV